MPSTADIAGALVAWVLDVLGDDASAGGIATTHDYPEMADFGPFPDLSVDVTRVRTVEGGAPKLSTAHHRRKQVDVALSILVELAEYRPSSHQLWGYADELVAAQDRDPALGFGRVHGVPISSSPWDFTLPGVVTREDGTEARELAGVCTIVVPA